MGQLNPYSGSLRDRTQIRYAIALLYYSDRGKTRCNAAATGTKPSSKIFSSGWAPSERDLFEIANNDPVRSQFSTIAIEEKLDVIQQAQELNPVQKIFS